MKPLNVLFLMIITAPCISHALILTPEETIVSEKIRYMQAVSGTDNSKMAALVQTDQAFTQWCNRLSTVMDLKRISRQEGFQTLYEQVKQGRALGMTQTKALLIKDNPLFCKEKA
ncbi:hypothetical protein AB6896_00080 [Rahnella inusitata]|uniref:hypothetical protein n=1 Tax=Rahnella inusitata TaxID=58169 RepID=UPI000E6B8073